MKKHLALVLALVMVLSSFSFVSAAPDFADVQGTVYEEAVDRLELLNILKGYPDGTFRPEDTITRAEFAAVAVRVSGLENVAMAAKGLPTGFTDVPAHHWASGYVGTAAKMGIVVGIGNGLFAPESPVKYEEAITMVVRALGYEPMAQARGGYPFGYLIVANEIDLLDGAMGTQGTWATRGFVAQITDNALEIPMMIQVGYGVNAEWVVSGEKDTDEEYLIERMGFEPIEGIVTRVDVSDMEIEIDDEEEGKDWYNVSAGFDFFVTRGAEVKAWVDGSDVIAYVVNDEVMFDAVEFDGDEITLVTADEDYDITRDVDDDFADNFTAEFAKVVVNGDDEVSFVEAYDFDGFILVEEIDDEIILDMNDDEVDVEDFVVLKDGKTVSVSDLVKGDVVFYYEDDVLGGEYDGLAIAYNESVMGEIDRVFTNSFRMDGDDYTLVGGALYLDEAGLDFISADLAEIEMMMDEEVEVELFLNFEEDVVLVIGDTGEGQTSTFYAVLTDDTVEYDGRSGDMLAVDVMTEFGEEVSYDFEIDELVDDSIENNFVFGTGNSIEFLAANDVLFEITVDEDGDVEEIDVLETDAVVAFEIDDTYAEIDGQDFRLMSSTVVFYDGNDEVITLGEIDDEFSEVEVGEAYVMNGRVEVVIATTTDSDTDTTDYTGLVTEILAIRGGGFEFTIEVAGVEMEFVTADDVQLNGDPLPAGFAPVNGENMIWTLEVGDTSNEIDEIHSVNMFEFKVKSVDTSADTIELVTPGTYGNADGEIELTSDAIIYDADDDFAELRLRDVEAGDVISVVFDGSSRYWAIYVIVDPAADVITPPAVEGVVTYIDDTNELIIVDGETYLFNATTVLYNASNDVVAVGTAILDITGSGANAELTVNDEVANIVLNADGTIRSLVGTSLAVQDAAIANVKTVADSATVLAAADLDAVAGLDYVLGNLAEYDTEIKATAAAAVDTLAELQAIIDEVDLDVEVDGFETTHSVILAETVSTIAIGDQAALTSAVMAYNALSADAKALLVDEKALMDDLQDKIDELEAAAVDTEIEALPAVADATLSDETAINAAKTSFDDLTNAQEALVEAANVTKLNALLDKMVTLNAEADVASDKAALNIVFTTPDTANSVTQDLTLAEVGASGNTTITWSSSNTAIVANDGTVTQPNGADVQVTLTATIASDDDASVVDTKIFVVTVIGI